MGIGLHCAQLCWMDCLIETVKLQTVLSADYCRSTQHFSTDGSILYFVMCKYWALELKYSLSMCACLCVQVSRSSSTWARRWMGWIWGRRWAYWVVTSCSVVRWSPAAMAMRPANSSTLTRLEDIWRYTFGSLYGSVLTLWQPEGEHWAVTVADLSVFWASWFDLTVILGLGNSKW